MIKIDNLSFGYNKNRMDLYNIDLNIKSGECVLLCGASGCGKTTITKTINGLIPHFINDCFLDGKVYIEDMVVANTELYEISKKVGSVFQNPKSQFFNLNTTDEIVFGLENAGVSPVDINYRLDRTIKSLNIKHLIDKNIFSLSGGEKQTIAFASIYTMNPDIYVLDEPTANLDEKAIGNLRKQIEFLKSNGNTIVIAEHRLYFLMDLVDRVIYLKDGKIVSEYSGESFKKISNDYRISLGLRTLLYESLNIPKATFNSNQSFKVENLCYGYKKDATILKDISFSVNQGEVLAITGQNGSGKSTLIRCLCGLIKQKSGTITLDSVVLNHKNRQKVSFCVMQDVNHQLFYDSVENECLQSVDDENINIDDILSQCDLLPFKESHPMALSGGQKQRLAIALALLSKKRVLIFDEPTSGLDYKHMIEVCKIVKKLASEGHIIIIVSHDREFMNLTCDKVLTLTKIF